MSRVKITEHKAKALVLGGSFYKGYTVRLGEAVLLRPKESYVAKVDEGVKKRFKSGLVAVNIGAPAVKKKLKEWALPGLVGVALVAVVLRLLGICWGLPHLYNADEPHIVNLAVSFGGGSLKPYAFKYPTLSGDRHRRSRKRCDGLRVRRTRGPRNGGVQRSFRSGILRQCLITLDRLDDETADIARLEATTGHHCNKIRVGDDANTLATATVRLENRRLSIGIHPKPVPIAVAHVRRMQLRRRTHELSRDELFVLPPAAG